MHAPPPLPLLPHRPSQYVSMAKSAASPPHTPLPLPPHRPSQYVSMAKSAASPPPHTHRCPCRLTGPPSTCQWQRALPWR